MAQAVVACRRRSGVAAVRLHGAAARSRFQPAESAAFWVGLPSLNRGVIEQFILAKSRGCVIVSLQLAAVNASAPETMHDDTMAAIRLLALALEAHPEDLEVLQIYGSMGEHLADLIDDYLDDGDDDGE